MALTFIAFIECVLEPHGHWIEMGSNYRGLNRGIRYKPQGIHAQMNLVDLKEDRRYFAFHNHNTEVRFVGNVVVFDNDDVEELAIDESKQFPKKTRMDEDSKNG